MHDTCLDDGVGEHAGDGVGQAGEGRYGSPRITSELRAAGWRVSENTVAALMREQGLRARPPRRRRHTTRPGKGRWRAPDLVGRRFAADGLNRRWYGDGTEITTGESKLHLASVDRPPPKFHGTRDILVILARAPLACWGLAECRDAAKTSGSEGRNLAGKS